jgi:hypothetical protein
VASCIGNVNLALQLRVESAVPIEQAYERNTLRLLTVVGIDVNSTAAACQRFAPILSCFSCRLQVDAPTPKSMVPDAEVRPPHYIIFLLPLASQGCGLQFAYVMYYRIRLERKYTVLNSLCKA